uniref:Uncharacterized protein n=1 Tax=Branchiostoma floridae TaxID=7739 RepID=C3YR18_BRAFL|eukprot:XP_002601248.1 hypothetical protein BRAFLDRAFT_95025 [Branchiostoma floridae]
MEDKQVQESGNDAIDASANQGVQKSNNGTQETVKSASKDNGNGEENAKRDTGGTTRNNDNKQGVDKDIKSQNGVEENEAKDSQLQTEIAPQSEHLIDEEVINILKEERLETEEQEQPGEKVKSTWEIECDQIRQEENPAAILAKVRDSLKEVITNVEGPERAEEFKSEFDASDYGLAIKAHKMHMIGIVRRLKTTWNEDTVIVDQLEPEVESAKATKEQLDEEMVKKDKRIAELTDLIGADLSAQTESDLWMVEILQGQLGTTSREIQLLSDEITKVREDPDWQEETLKAMQDRLDEVETLFAQKKQKKKVVKSKMVKVLRMYSTATETIGGVSKKRRKTEESDEKQNDIDDNSVDESADSINGTSSVQDEHSCEDEETSVESDTESVPKSDGEIGTSTESDSDSSESSDKEVETSDESDTDSSEDSPSQTGR